MIIRVASLDDARSIARVRVDTWRTAYRGIIPDELLDSLSYEDIQKNFFDILSRHKSKEIIYVAEEETVGVVGFVYGGVERNGNPDYQGEIYAMYILKEHQRRGIGRLLVKAVVGKLYEQGITSILVWVLANNYYRQFYESLRGEIISESVFERDGAKVNLVAYGWKDTSNLLDVSK